MNMKKVIQSLCLLAVLTGAASCQHPEQKFSIAVADETGHPLKGIECKAWFKKPGDGGSIKDYHIIGNTDASGKVELSGETIWAPTSVEARKDGYYLSTAGNHWTIKKNGNRWEPWPVKVNLVMKKIRNPKPMYAVKPRDHLTFWHPDPENLKPSGFDLMKMDWTAPHGKGEIADLLVEGLRDNPEDRGFVQKGKLRVFHQVKGILKIAFPNPGDGVLRLNDPGGSILWGPSTAPTEGYVNYWEVANHGESSFDDTVCHVFRIRSVLDENGEVVGGLYGKIEGQPEARFGIKPFFRMTYYLNATLNELNLEWDKKTNLFSGLDQQYWPVNH
jgi:hypothetical protein